MMRGRSSPELSGVLAGQVITSFDGRPPPRTYVQVRPTSGKGAAEPTGAPIDHEIDSNGYFTIVGLEPGRQYQLIARGHDGQKLLAGMAWATPPNSRMVIPISSQFAGTAIPPLPAAPAYPSKDPAKPKSSDDARTQSNAGGRAAELMPPVPGGVAPAQMLPPRPAPSVDARPPRPDLTRTININNPFHAPPAPLAPAPTSPVGTKVESGSSQTGAATAPVVSTAVPSCSMKSKDQLDNVALYDFEGNIWEFRKQNSHRLILLDFWGSWCVPCVHSIPGLNRLQTKYGLHGLGVVGIAYENGSPAEQVAAVRQARVKHQINYALLVGSGRRAPCPVRDKLVGHELVPTLVLLDENGQVLWRHTGGLDQHGWDDLDSQISRRLSIR
jgi:thiol-disulfide isomerase/thioredoxin